MKAGRRISAANRLVILARRRGGMFNENKMDFGIRGMW
jgi:hypothetical protein